MNTTKHLSPLKMSPGRIICEKTERRKPGLLILSDTAKDKDEWGSYEFTIIGVGPDRKLDNGTTVPSLYKVGDKIMPLFNQCVTFSIRGRKYLTLPQEAVIGVEDSTAITMLESDDATQILSAGGIAG